MRVVLDLPEDLLRRLQELVAQRGYASLAALTTVALENQLSIERSEDGQAHIAPELRASRKSPSAPSIVEGGALSLERRISPPVLEPTEAASRSVDAGWLWGIINRVLPIKVAARSLLIDTEHAASRLEAARDSAAARAQALASSMIRRYGSDRPTRDESLVTGFPLREPVFKARERFADHFFGRVDGSGRASGALFELGMAGLEREDSRYRTALTLDGADFAGMTNPVLDEGRLDRALNDGEIEWYVEQVALRVPRERACFAALLGALAKSEMSVEGLTEVARQNLPKALTEAAIQTMKAGALGRLDDLQLITRDRAGRTVRFLITQRGEKVLERIHAPLAEPTSTATKAARKKK